MADKFLKSLNIGDGNIYKPLPLLEIGGKVWTQSNITSGSFNPVYYADGLWVAGGSNNNGIYYSTDGKNWTQSNVTNGVMHDFFSVYYTNGTWIAGGNAGLWHSTDGKVWIQSNVTEGYFYSVYYGNGIWVACGDKLYYSESSEGKILQVVDGEWAVGMKL